MKDWSKLKDLVQRGKPRAMYDREIHGFLSTLAKEHFSDQADLRERFIAAFDLWLNGSRLNALGGISAFPHRDFCVGVTHFLDDLHQMNGERIVVVQGDYRYHWRLRPQIVMRTPESLAPGDVLILAMPFPSLGDVHPRMQEFLDRALQLKVPVHVDSAWYGCTRGIHFDYDHPAIRSIGFSLSKGLGLGANRIGVRYSRERTNGPITILNDHSMWINVLLWYGIKAIEEFGSDYLWNKYGARYDEAVKELKLVPTKAIHLARELDAHGNLHPVGLRTVLRVLKGDLILEEIWRSRDDLNAQPLDPKSSALSN